MAKAIVAQQRAKDLAALQAAQQAEQAAQQKAAEEQARRRAAEEQARRRAEEERARKRAALREQIQRWDDKLAGIRSQLSGLEAEQSRLNTYLEEWAAQRNVYNGNRILSEVVIVNVFEGVCADKIKTDLSGCMAEMSRTCGRVNGLNGNVGAQIARLHQQMSSINARLSSMRNELNSI